MESWQITAGFTALTGFSVAYLRRYLRPKRHRDVLGSAVIPLCPAWQPEEGYKAEMAFKPRSSDIIIATFPKTGNTLLSQLAHQLRSPGDDSFTDMYDVVPFLEFLWPLGIDNPDESDHSFNKLHPRVFKHHKFLSACFDDGKYVTIFRDPRSSLVSLFNMCLSNGHAQEGSTIEDFAETIGFFADNALWGANIWSYYAEQWRCRHCNNVLLLCFEDLVTNLESQASLLAAFMGVSICIPSNAFNQVKVMCSRQFMLENAHKYDESITYSRIRAVGRWDVPHTAASRVTSGKHHGKHVVSNELAKKLDAKWKSTIGKAFGFDDYPALRNALCNFQSSKYRS